MKRLNWLRNFGLIASAACATAPAILTTTSCGVTSCYIDMFDFQTTVKGGASGGMDVLKHYSTSFNNLLYGTKANHNGNYILFIGSNTNDSIVNFFAPEQNFRDRDQWYGEQFYKTAFYRALVQVTTDAEIVKEGIKDCGFYNFIDFCDWKYYDKTGHEIFISKDGKSEVQIVKPFDKWTDGIISQTKTYNKTKPNWNYDWDDESVSKSDYIRQDEFAVAYREICKRGKDLYPKTDKRTETFNTDDNSDSPKMCIFKDGTLVSIENIPDGTSKAGIDAFVKKVVDNYKVVKDEKK